jgi:hypothetical protein
MCGWRDEIEEKRKRMERFRELLRSVQENQLAGLQTGGDFAREAGASARGGRLAGRPPAPVYAGF